MGGEGVFAKSNMWIPVYSLSFLFLISYVCRQHCSYYRHSRESGNLEEVSDEQQKALYVYFG